MWLRPSFCSPVKSFRAGARCTLYPSADSQFYLLAGLDNHAPLSAVCVQVYSELLHELEGGPAGLVDMMEANTDSLMEMLDAAGPSDFLSCLDMHVHNSGGSDVSSPPPAAP